MCPACRRFPALTSSFSEIAESIVRHGSLYVCMKCNQFIEVIPEERSVRYLTNDERICYYPTSSSSARYSLSRVAYSLAEEIRDQKWSLIADLSKKPAADCSEIMLELMARCPGFTREEYRRAISTALFESR